MSVESGNGRSATLEEVARVAGVSRATVSRVVNGNPKVGVETKREVERAIARLGYIPNPAARSLVTRRSQSIGLVIAEPAGRVFEDPFFPRLLRGIVLRSPRATCSWSSSCRSRRARRRAPSAISRRATSTALCSSASTAMTPCRRRSGAARHPRRRRRPAAARRGVSYVDVDNVAGRADGGRAPARAGRSAIATIAGPQDMSPAKIAWRATVRRSRRRHGVATRRSRSTGTSRAGRAEATRRLLDRDRSSTPSLPPPT